MRVSCFESGLRIYASIDFCRSWMFADACVYTYGAVPVVDRFKLISCIDVYVVFFSLQVYKFVL